MDGLSPTTLKWGVGLTVTILIFIASTLWAASDKTSRREAEIKVLEARVNNMENTITSIVHSTSQISNNISQLMVQQSAFQARFEAEISNLKDVTKSLRDVGHRRSGSSQAPAP